MALQIVEVDLTHLVRATADSDDACLGSFQDQRQQQTGQGKVTEVVGAKLGLEAVSRLAAGDGHHAGIVDQQVQPVVLRHKSIGEGVDRGLAGQVQCHDLQVGRG